MAWFAELAGKAENLLNNLDEQTGVALRNHNVTKSKKHDRNEFLHYPEPTWTQKKRPIPRALKKMPPSDTKSNYVPSRKASPILHHSPTRESQEPRSTLPKLRRSSPKKPYNLNHCPKTLVGDVGETEITREHRRFSLPSELDGFSSENLSFRMENLEVENAMLRNELNVMNREVADLIDRLRKTEDGETVVFDSSEELTKTNTKLQSAENLNNKVNQDKNSFASQLEQLKVMYNLTTTENCKLKEQKVRLDRDITQFKQRNEELEAIIRKLDDKTNDSNSIQGKLENDLRHAQSTIMSLQSDLERSNAECRRLEKDWETYKHRVKGMLSAKDKEVKALQEGINLTEDTKILVEQIDNLREEREVLSAAVTRVRGECNDMKQYMESLENRHTAAERVVIALRDALKDERAARNRAETQSAVIAKELKSIQIETGQTIASLRTALRDKDNELHQLKDSTSSSVRTSDTSALNVADYDVSQYSIDNEKLCYLTQKLVQSQGKIDKLLAENNTLRIQLEKLESKYKVELASIMRKKVHSVVHFQENDQQKTRSHHQSVSSFNKFSRRIDMLVRRNALFRMLMIFYMIGLHFWVITVLFTSTPDDYNKLNK